MNILKKLKRSLAEILIQVEKLDPIADKDVVEFRLSQCLKCPNNSDGTEQGECKICKCFVDLKAETYTNRKLDGTIEITHCPEGKWDDQDILLFYS